MRARELIGVNTIGEPPISDSNRTALNQTPNQGDDSDLEPLSSAFEGVYVDSEEITGVFADEDWSSADLDSPTCETGNASGSNESLDLSVASPESAEYAAVRARKKAELKKAWAEIPKRIGDYSITGLIGSGGWGRSLPPSTFVCSARSR